MKILLTEAAALVYKNDVSLDLFHNLGEFLRFENISREELLNQVKDTDVILCNKVLIDAEVMDKAPRLKYIGTCATGYNNVDIIEAKKRGITVCNVSGYSTNAVCQQVMAYILMHYTKTAEYNSFVKEGGWKNSPIFAALNFDADEIYGKTLGIIGFGNIGKAVKKAAEGLGLNVIVYTRTPKPYENTVFVSFDELLQKSDIVTVHCPLTEQTADLMNEKAFSKMKDGAFFINTSRGGVVDEVALKNALVTGKLSGAAVDVLKMEPMDKASDLEKTENLTITPHIAWAPKTTRVRLVKQVYEILEKFLNGEEVNNLAK
ncbi:MAG: D-2-hydroxyacid dehydrogenase [Clostridia bacterium]|nr:D-2-hydroxyacid dehydrogenase [Clostridia bacterium]